VESSRDRPRSIAVQRCRLACPAHAAIFSVSNGLIAASCSFLAHLPERSRTSRPGPGWPCAGVAVAVDVAAQIGEVETVEGRVRSSRPDGSSRAAGSELLEQPAATSRTCPPAWRAPRTLEASTGRLVEQQRFALRQRRALQDRGADGHSGQGKVSSLHVGDPTSRNRPPI